MAINTTYIPKSVPISEPYAKNSNNKGTKNGQCTAYKNPKNYVGILNLNNITEYECVYRTQLLASDTKLLSAIHIAGYTLDDNGNFINGSNIFSRVINKHGYSILPEHWSHISCDDKNLPLNDNNTEINTNNYNTWSKEPIDDNDDYGVFLVLSECISHSLPNLSNEIIKDFTNTKKFSLIEASNKDITIVISALKDQINKRYASPKYKSLYKTSANELTSLSNILLPDKQSYITLLSLLVECIKRLLSPTNYDLYPETKITTPNNVILTNIIKDAANAITYDMQDCICYSDCNGYSVCWCYGNCNYY